MALYVKIENGKVVDHPMEENNFRSAFPDVDVNNLPSSFAVFQRKEMPELGVYEVYEGHTYGLEDGVWTDVFNIRPMTDLEEAAKRVEVEANSPPKLPYATKLYRGLL